ncbi:MULTISPECIES: protein-ADP-ribose hydrolase [Streptomyces]|uniref:protein-ADP-ribose hydrolase n=1 Tax=Streptomyces TaxID=1883 RepID=UPI00211B63D6|nr:MULTISPECIES: protein-ADP-ribose hydrolase [Streptomyces]MDX3587406.1 protein-ADP-ribose hydrolase [Streptomyces europaeiscabiei]MDX3615766.1 protein-ADP-ribose hydrolase [Streptomyces europaeiscabiei]MDX3636830.1 protein-ADP-ribose hydrolase [Streptomyces europaeiscabiei]MDX3655055.1 protein-ADP-ribose hydrolase [Streptomyces europaeiscabiei]
MCPTPTLPPAPAALPLPAYRAAIALDEPFGPDAGHDPDDRPADLVREALGLLGEDPATTRIGLRPGAADRIDDAAARRLLRAVLTVRQPDPLPTRAARVLDALLAGERLARDTTDAASLPTVRDTLPHAAYRAADRTVLWQGDITTLGADAVVNAANSALLGCFAPMHPCIDNALHAAAGPRLRTDCHTIMSLQGHPEPTGTAKITRGYHLPARYVLHTVGPIVDGPVLSEHQQALAASYRACLDLAAEAGGIRSLTFCGISTGVFGYPKAPAARIALDSVAEWLDLHPGRLDRVIFNVYADDDRAAYLQALTEGTQPR